jgi:hypothetical protein
MTRAENPLDDYRDEGGCDICEAATHQSSECPQEPLPMFIETMADDGLPRKQHAAFASHSDEIAWLQKQETR